MPNQSGKIVLVLVLLLLILGAGAYFFSPGFKPQYTESPPILQSTTDEGSQPSVLAKDYYSKNLKINIKVPQEAEVEEKFTDINLKFPNGKIQIRRIGTNFKSIKDYFENLKEVNDLELLSEEYNIVNDYEYVLIFMEDTNSRVSREYSLYANNWVFKFASSDESLYPVLDQIVQSFEYKGTLSSEEDKP